MTEYIVDGDCLIPRLEGLTLQIHFKTNGEIVRCRDCKYYGFYNSSWCRRTYESVPGGTCDYQTVEPDGFCKWGERKAARREQCFSIGRISDGHHTFDELYYHRTALFACLVSLQPRQMAFKSWRHADGSMYEGYFIAGIFTSRGWSTYHCESLWWPLFSCSEMDRAPKWDGHTPSDAIHRLMDAFLPEQDVCGEEIDEIERGGEQRDGE